MGAELKTGPVTIYTIGGDPASGKSTVASLLAQAVGFKRLYAGGILRGWSQDSAHNPQQLPFEQWYATLDPSIDNRVDEMLKQAAAADDNLVLEGRMAFFWPASGKHKLSVYIRVDPAVGAKRVYEQKQRNPGARKEEKAYCCVHSAREELRQRKEIERERYKTLYNVDIHDPALYGLTLDSTLMTPESIVDFLLRVGGHRTTP